MSPDVSLLSNELRIENYFDEEGNSISRRCAVDELPIIGPNHYSGLSAVVFRNENTRGAEFAPNRLLRSFPPDSTDPDPKPWDVRLPSDGDELK